MQNAVELLVEIVYKKYSSSDASINGILTAGKCIKVPVNI